MQQLSVMENLLRLEDVIHGVCSADGRGKASTATDVRRKSMLTVGDAIVVHDVRTSFENNEDISNRQFGRIKEFLQAFLYKMD